MKTSCHFITVKYVANGVLQYETWIEDIAQETLKHFDSFKEKMEGGRIFFVIPKGGLDPPDDSNHSAQCVSAFVTRVWQAKEMKGKLVEYHDLVDSEKMTFEVKMDTVNDKMPHPLVFCNGENFWV